MGVVRPHPETEREIYAHVSEKRAGAFFFLPKPESRSLVELATTAGMEGAGLLKLSNEPGAEVVTGRWAGFFSVVRLRDYPEHVALEIYFSFVAFLTLYDGLPSNLTELPLEEDPALPVAHAFRDASLQVGAEIGFLTLSSNIAATDYMEREIYPLVRLWDARGLSIPAGLLYVNENVMYNLFDMPDLDHRDQLPVERGMLVFGQRGPDRWY